MYMFTSLRPRRRHTEKSQKERDPEEYAIEPTVHEDARISERIIWSAMPILGA